MKELLRSVKLTFSGNAGDPWICQLLQHLWLEEMHGSNSIRKTGTGGGWLYLLIHRFISLAGVAGPETTTQS